MPAIASSIVFPQTVARRPRHAGGWTYQDYAALPEDGHRYEILEGRLVMSPSPAVGHQRFLYTLAKILESVIGQEGEVFIAPLDVELSAPSTDAPSTVVQPDVFVILKASRRAKILESHIVGVPDLVVEVLSPGTTAYDHHDKFDAYAKAGLGELWLADPASRAIEVFHGGRGGLRLVAVATGDQRLPSRALPHLKATAASLFATR